MRPSQPTSSAIRRCSRRIAMAATADAVVSAPATSDRDDTVVTTKSAEVVVVDCRGGYGRSFTIAADGTLRRRAARDGELPTGLRPVDV